MKVYVVGSAKYYVNFMTDVELTNDIRRAKVVLFTGGEDVDPSIYGRTKLPQTYSNIERDLKEKEIFEKVRPNQLVVGICRGSQFCCVMNGGNLVQDCTGHALRITHPIYGTKDNMVYEITSTHHQMQYPFNLPPEDFDILYYGVGGRNFRGDGIDSNLLQDYNPEVVLYHKKDMPKCLAIQGHPEMMPDSPVAKMLDKLIKSLC